MVAKYLASKNKEKKKKKEGIEGLFHCLNELLIIFLPPK